MKSRREHLLCFLHGNAGYGSRLHPLYVVRQLPHGRELDALRRITDDLFVRPPCCPYAPTEFNELVFWNVDVKGSDLHCCVVRVAVNLRSRELRPGGLLFFL